MGNLENRHAIISQAGELFGGGGLDDDFQEASFQFFGGARLCEPQQGRIF